MYSIAFFAFFAFVLFNKAKKTTKTKSLFMLVGYEVTKYAKYVSCFLVFFKVILHDNYLKFSTRNRAWWGTFPTRHRVLPCHYRNTFFNDVVKVG